VPTRSLSAYDALARSGDNGDGRKGGAR
jgi:hypothetical protein